MTERVAGIAHWGKILGNPGKAYNPGEREWSLDLALDKEGVKKVEALGMGNQIKKGKGKDYEPYIVFKRAEFKKSGPRKGEANQPIEVVDATGKAWPSNELLGNGTKVGVEFNTYEVPAFRGNPASVKPAILKVFVLEHVKYERPENADGTTSTRQPEAWV